MIYSKSLSHSLSQQKNRRMTNTLEKYFLQILKSENQIISINEMLEKSFEKNREFKR